MQSLNDAIFGPIRIDHVLSELRNKGTILANYFSSQAQGELLWSSFIVNNCFKGHLKYWLDFDQTWQEFFYGPL